MAGSRGVDSTVGVEEEFLLVDDAGRLSRFGPEVIDSAEYAGGELQKELSRCQVETATAVCRTAAEVLDELRDMRKRLAEQAAERGLRLLPSGTPVLAEDAPPEITPNPRYRSIAENFGAIASTVTTCSCHVHVAIPDPATGVQISNQVRPWLPVLLALTANSPYNEGADTGYCSWRHVQWARWPSAGPPPLFHSLEHYELSVQGMLESGAMLDRGMLYWDVRLSDKQPTLEFRVCDVAGTAAEAALLAAVVRGLVATARRDLEDRRSTPQPSQEVLKANLWRAARDGLAGQCPHPVTGVLTPMRTQVEDLAVHIRPALEAAGDLDDVRTGLDTLYRTGTGAQRQRAAFAENGRLDDVIDLLVRQVDL